MQASLEARASAFACGLAAIALLIWLIALASKGLEFTDEGFYLIWLAQPGSLPNSVTQFGFVYHPIYRLLDGDIGALRRFNVLLTFGLAVWMFGALLRNAEGATGLMRAGVTLALAASGLAVFSAWLLTPSYNSLCIQSFLLAVTGALKLNEERWRVGALLVGLGGALAFLAKPSSALALAGLMAIVVARAPRDRRIRILLLATAVALVGVLVAACAIDGDPSRFVERLTVANEDWQRLVGWQGAATLFRWDSFALTLTEKVVVVASVAGAIAAAVGLGCANRALRTGSACLITGTALLSIASLYSGVAALPRTQFVATVLCAPALALLPFAVRDSDSSRVVQGLCIAGLSAAFAFGTSNHYWQVGSVAGVFWIAGVGAVPRKTCFTIWPPAAALSLLASATLLTHGAAAPYRQQQPIQEQLTPVALPGGSALWLAQDSAEYVEALSHQTEAAGWVSGLAVIDLTGQSPTIQHLMQARALGAAWWIGGYPGSDEVARATISRLPCSELAAAWLLLEPEGPRALSEDLPKLWGMEIKRDYVVVARLVTPPGAGGYPQPREQAVLRPLREPGDALEACEKSRGHPPEQSMAETK